MMDLKNQLLFKAACVMALAAPALASNAEPAPRPSLASQGLELPAAASVLEHWRNPPSDYGPEPYYGMAAGVSASEIGAELDRLKSLGLRAVTVQYTRDMPFAYLSPEYFAFFKRFVAEARRRDMRIWIVDDAGYPSGFAGGKFTTQASAMRMKALVRAGDWTVAADQWMDEAAPPDLVAVSAINADDGEVRAIDVRQGRIHWQAPAHGTWRVIAVAHAFRTSPTRSDTNPARTKDGSQSLHDYLDPAATAQYLRFTHEAYLAAVGDEFGKTILGFRGDEPDYSIDGLPWTTSFLERFRQVKGYDPRPYLPALLQGPGTALSARQLLFRADYDDIFSRMFADSFFKQQADWCARHAVQYQVHLNREEAQIALASQEGDFFRAMGPVQSPGVDAIWHQIWPDTVADYPRFASSVAHLHGRPQAMTESFAAYRPEARLSTVRYAVDEQLVRGINLFEFMYIHGGRPTSGYFADPGFPGVADYVRRASYLMSMGRPAAQVAVLQSRGALWTQDRTADAMFVSTERMLSEAQIDFDLVDEDSIGDTLKAGPGSFETASGNRYRTVIVPMSDLMPERVVERLRAFANGGGKVLFIGRTPPRVVETTYLNARAAKPREFAWAKLSPQMLAPVPTPPALPPQASPAPLVVPAALAGAVRAAVGQDDLVLKSADPALRYIHRRLADATVFLLFNESARQLTNRVTLHGRGARVEAWDPATAAATPVPSRAVAGGREVDLDLNPYTSKVFVLRQ
jgi:hypothetical protein